MTWQWLPRAKEQPHTAVQESAPRHNTGTHNTCAHSFIHQSQGGHVRVVCLCHARVCTVVLRALSVRMLWCMW